MPPVVNFPVRQWSIEIVLLDENNNEIPATIFEKVVYHLHPTFANPNRTFTEPPFKIEEKGWGGFPLDITVYFLEKAGERKILHDLNFLKEEYEVDHVVQVPLSKPALVTELEKSGGIEEPDSNKRKNSQAAPSSEPKSKKAKTNSASTIKGNVDLEKLALGLTKLSEDDLIGVVQMISDNNTPEMNVTNNAEEGEFIVDLYSLPDGLLKSLWDYVRKGYS